MSLPDQVAIGDNIDKARCVDDIAVDNESIVYKGLLHVSRFVPDDGTDDQHHQKLNQEPREIGILGGFTVQLRPQIPTPLLTRCYRCQILRKPMTPSITTEVNPNIMTRTPMVMVYTRISCDMRSQLPLSPSALPLSPEATHCQYPLIRCVYG